MTNIKIFVSNRIDKRAQQIDNPIFIPVRCGAVFDDLAINSNMLGDNTGDNISEKRMSFCELTVQYWAWKNQEADYFGICHYRRYISFKSNNAKKSVEERNNGCITIDNLSDENIEKFGLTEAFMRSEIEKYDAIFIEPIDLSRYNYNNYSAMEHSPDYHIMHDMDIAMEIICEKYPYMKDIVKKYMYDYKYEYLYNCFVMRAELFDAYSKWLFDILFELERRIDMSTYTMKQYRTPGTIAERLLGIYILYLESLNKYKIKHNTLIFFDDTEPVEPLIPAFKEHNIPYREVNFFNTPITRDDIMKMLENTEDGFEDIISTRSKVFMESNLNIEDMKFNELVDFIIAHPSVLKRPIIVDDNKMQVGYNDEEIRTFIPREIRRAWTCNNKTENCEYAKELKYVLDKAKK